MIQIPEFQEFLKSQGISEEHFKFRQTLRYIRFKPNYFIEIPQMKQIEWLSDIYSLPMEQKLTELNCYLEGNAYGIDLSSAAVVLSLDIQPTDRSVLDICCAPGAKLLYISDLLSEGSKVIGVDISQNRLNITRSLMKKYKSTNIELVQADGTKYSNEDKFDKVLVDAECTHEGSLKHLQKYYSDKRNESIDENKSKKTKKQEKQSQKQLKDNHTNQYISEFANKNEWGIEDFKNRFLDPIKLEQIKNLQKNLLENGFQQLKINGILVYSTCSFSKLQNEDVILEFIENHQEDAVLIDPFSHIDKKIPFTLGHINKTVRFEPQICNSGGMFLAKIQKIK